MAKPEKVRLGDVLVQQKLLSQEQLRQALDQQSRSGRRLGRVLVDMGLVNEDKMSEALAKQLKLEYINLKFFNINRDVARKLPEAQARRYRTMVLEDVGERYRVGMADPTDLFAFDEITR